MAKFAKRIKEIPNIVEYVYYNGENNQEIIDMFPDEFGIVEDDQENCAVLYDHIDEKDVEPNVYVVKDPSKDYRRYARILYPEEFKSMFEIHKISEQQLKSIIKHTQESISNTPDSIFVECISSGSFEPLYERIYKEIKDMIEG